MSWSTRGSGYGGGSRGRGRGRGRGGTQFGDAVTINPVASASLLSGFEKAKQIEVHTPGLYDGTPCKPRNVRAISSFDWVDGRTIRVPGLPPVWKEPNLPLKIEHDSGDAFVDQQAELTSRMGIHRSSGLFAAIDAVDPNFAYEQVDVITDRNNVK
ncbi:hypothetical protein BT69DRAFT_1072266, partial [Atractiella rhizophila]